jgi:hypothetical protein
MRERNQLLRQLKNQQLSEEDLIEKRKLICNTYRNKIKRFKQNKTVLSK